MSEIFRLRPADSLLIEELVESYLWFTRPTEFNDVEDSNILSFLNNNETIKSAFIRLFGKTQKIIELSSKIGICCFSETLPDTSLWGKFPKGYNGVFIKFDKNAIETLFLNNFGIKDCFKKIEYSPSPVLFEKYSNYDIFWEKTKNGKLFKSIETIEKDEKLIDELFLKMFTRINEKYSFQKEFRIILAGNNVPDKSNNIKGYKILIPRTSILGIYIHPNTPIELIERIESFDFKIIKT